MEESEKSKQEKELQKLETLEQRIKIKNLQEIQELTEEIGVGKVSFVECIKVIVKKTALNRSNENDPK